MGCHVRQSSFLWTQTSPRRILAWCLLNFFWNGAILIQPAQSYVGLGHPSAHRINHWPAVKGNGFQRASRQCSNPLLRSFTRTTTTTTITLLAANAPENEQDKKVSTTNTTAAAAATTTTVIEGIGGKGGYVYNVNSLKRNLLQETMSAYKEELFELLSRSTPTDDAEVVEKLLALVQASPVRTTTDSNLLDGDDDWVLAYRSRYPTTVSSLVLYEGDTAGGGPRYNARYNFLFSTQVSSSSPADNSRSPTAAAATKKKQRSGGGGSSSVVWNKAKEFCQTKQRSFKLEHLDDDEDAYIMDTTSILGGILTKTNIYALEGLTRSSLTLHKESTRWSVLIGRSTPKHTTATTEAAPSEASSNRSSSNNNKSKQGNSISSNNNNNNQKSFSIQIIYLDNDLCILTEEDGPDSPFMVYTRNKAYLDIYKSMQRKFKLLKMAVWGLVSLPIRSIVRNRVGDSRRGGWRNANANSGANDPILKVVIRNDPSNKSSSSSGTNGAAKLRVLRLGDVNGEEEDESWESESDPFVHLSADERQRLLKAMSVGEVDQAADTYRNSQMRFRFLRKLFGRRKKNYFKKPPEKWRRPKK